MNATLPLLKRTDFPALRRRVLETLQVNLGYRCNQSCVHCHVNAGPGRTEQMSLATLQVVLDFIRARVFMITGEQMARRLQEMVFQAAISDSLRGNSPKFL